MGVVRDVWLGPASCRAFASRTNQNDAENCTRWQVGPDVQRSVSAESTVVMPPRRTSHTYCHVQTDIASHFTLPPYTSSWVFYLVPVHTYRGGKDRQKAEGSRQHLHNHHHHLHHQSQCQEGNSAAAKRTTLHYYYLQLNSTNGTLRSEHRNVFCSCRPYPISFPFLQSWRE